MDAVLLPALAGVILLGIVTAAALLAAAVLATCRWLWSEFRRGLADITRIADEEAPRGGGSR